MRPAALALAMARLAERKSVAYLWSEVSEEVWHADQTAAYDARAYLGESAPQSASENSAWAGDSRP